MSGVPTESNTGLIGANTAYVQTVADLAKLNPPGQPMYPVLTTTGGKGRKAVWAKATEAIAGNTAACAISAAGNATATLGTYLSPATTLANGDYAWFTQASPA
jgi:hypothetical protein